MQKRTHMWLWHIWLVPLTGSILWVSELGTISVPPDKSDTQRKKIQWWIQRSLICPVQMLFRCSLSTWVAREGLNSRLSLGGEHDLKSNIVNCSNYTPFVLLPRLWWSPTSKLSGNKPARQHEQLKHHLYPFMVPELSCPEGQTRLPQAQQGLTSSECEVKHEAFAAERHTQQIIFGLSEYLQLRVALWKLWAELTCCVELCPCWGRLFPQKCLPEDSDLAQVWISRVSFTIWNCKL